MPDSIATPQTTTATPQPSATTGADSSLRDVRTVVGRDTSAVYHHAAAPAVEDVVFRPQVDDTASMYPRLDTAQLQLWELMHPQAADTVAVKKHAVKKLPPDWEKGLEPVPLTVTGADSPWMSAVLVAMILVVTLCLRHSRRLFVNMTRQLVGLRSRSKDFDEHTAGETRLMTLFGLQYSLYAGILLQTLATIFLDNPALSRTFVYTLIYTAVAGLFYVFSLSAYSIVGYTFTTPELKRQWLRGFNSTQVFLGFALMPVALIAVFHPSWALMALYVGAGLYCLARGIFIFKGFRIFYSNFGSLLYFILYLCALEIIPLVFLAAAVFLIGSNNIY